MNVEEIIDEFGYFGGVFENLQFEFSEKFLALHWIRLAMQIIPGMH